MIELNKKERMATSGGENPGECSCMVDTGNAMCQEIELRRWELGDINHETCQDSCCKTHYASGSIYTYKEKRPYVIEPFEIRYFPLEIKHWC